MAIQVAIRHNTEYEFDRSVQVHPHVVRLRPAPHCRTPIKSYSLKVEPEDHFVNWQQDPFGNHLARFVFPEKTRSLGFHVELVAEMVVINPFDFFLEESVETFPFKYDKLLKQDLAPYLKIGERGKLLTDWVRKIDRRKSAVVPFLVRINQEIQHYIEYEIRMEQGVQTCEETLVRKKGSCRDSAWLLVQVLRQLGLAARFVSGYLVQLTSDQKSLDGPSGPESDFTDLHAWAEVFLPGAGWIGLDPTSGLFAGEGHLPLACTPEPATAAAITGTTGVCETSLVFSNTVERIIEDPRVTKPYAGSQWKLINALGGKVDKQLRTSNVKLTMGGEPTFVSIDDMEGAQWNNDALGKEKRVLAGQLLQRLKSHFAPKGMLHYGQGKWYPGEPLPRWALTLFWRKDNRPVWSDESLLADETQNYDYTPEDASNLMSALVGELGLPPKRIVTAFENPGYYLWRESTLPKNVSPEDSKLKDPLERKRLARLFSRGLDEPAGFALPLKFVADGGNGYWQTGPWPFRSGNLLLIPGDSPLGYRIPFDSLPWTKPPELEPELDPFTDLAPLTALTKRNKKIDARDIPGEIVHTALCVEQREGKLYIFMPPLARADYYLELLTSIEEVVQRLKLKIVIEGYEPPFDPRISLLQITPDPGVIEVNIHPSGNWQDLVANTTLLYEAARQTRLGTEKFMLDGRHSGTGGGNHVTLGSELAEASPFLRRPHLLRSLITFWQHHPALSYLFSGMFIGPTSQSPRVDEARDDNLYELEVAFDQLPKGESKKPWLVDRILRNFLIDLTGNTHRSEFCIDKLYSPDSASGRKGIVEFRAFEMPPHPQMSLLQMLLVRALVARFWKKPYQGKLIRWGTELHDRFMLGHYVWDDMKSVIDFLNDSGYEFELDWFGSFREFRFPRIGSVNAEGIQLDLHTALEPWHVLGEESTGQGTSRYVDSSVERIQVSISGMTEGKYIVSCNGRRVPLKPTGVTGSYVAGVRYKAWDPHSAMHPTIGVHTPLTFDIIDVYNERSIGGCTYHVSHPGGRNYDTFPVNANEAEARRHARFSVTGHTQGKLELPAEEIQPEQPNSLDLRLLPPQ